MARQGKRDVSRSVSRFVMDLPLDERTGLRSAAATRELSESAYVRRSLRMTSEIDKMIAEGGKVQLVQPDGEVIGLVFVG